MPGDPLRTAATGTIVEHGATSHVGETWDLTLALVGGAVLLGSSFVLRGVVKRRLGSKTARTSVNVPYYDVDSLDYGFGGTSGHAGSSAGSSPRLYPERWLMLFLYSLNMATLSVLASTLPSSQLPAEQLYGIQAYPIVTLMSVLVFLSLPATVASSVLASKYGIRGTCVVALGISLVGAWIIAFAAFTASWYLQIAGTVVMGLGAPMLANACTGLSAKWFGADERNLPTALGSMIPGAVAGAVFNEGAVTQKRLLPTEFLLVAVMCTVAAGMFVLIYQERPPTPASAEEPSASNVTVRL